MDKGADDHHSPSPDIPIPLVRNRDNEHSFTRPLLTAHILCLYSFDAFDRASDTASPQRVGITCKPLDKLGRTFLLSVTDALSVQTLHCSSVSSSIELRMAAGLRKCTTLPHYMKDIALAVDNATRRGNQEFISLGRRSAPAQCWRHDPVCPWLHDVTNLRSEL